MAFVQLMFMTHKRKVYVKAYYDEELSPPQWGIIRFHKNPDKSLEVFDWDGADNKTDAKRRAKKIAERRGEILEE